MRWVRTVFRPSAGRRLSVLAAIGLNAVPVVGVLFLDWPLLALVVVYWAELGVDLACATVRGVFAQRPSRYDDDSLVLGALGRKRGSISLPLVSPPVHVRNLPVVAVAVPVFGTVWLVVGIFAIGGVGQAVVAGSVSDAVALTAAVGIVGIVLTRSGETAVEYATDRTYLDVSAQGALRSAFGSVVVVGGAMLAAGYAAIAGAPPVGSFVGIVCTKLLLDIGTIYADRLVAFDERDPLELGLARDPPERRSVDPTLDGAVETVRPRFRPLVFDGIARGVRAGACLALVGLGVAFGGLAVLSDSTELVWFAARGVGVVLVVFAIAGIFDRLLRYYSVVYRVGDAVVCHDTVLDCPQWRVGLEEIATAETQRDWVDRLLDTETLVVDTGDHTWRIPHLTETSTLLERARETNRTSGSTPPS